MSRPCYTALGTPCSGISPPITAEGCLRSACLLPFVWVCLRRDWSHGLRLELGCLERVVFLLLESCDETNSRAEIV